MRCPGEYSASRILVLRHYLVGAILLALAAGGLISLQAHVLALDPPYVYQKEIKQDYLVARAALDGANPYALFPELTARYLPAATEYVTAHPAPHPPFAVALSLPLGLTSYETACAIWLALDLLCLMAVAFGLALTPGPLPFSPRKGSAAGARVNHPARLALTALLVFCALLTWQPVRTELLLGQWSSLLAALLVGAWLAYQTRRESLAGVLLGLAIAVKLFPVVVAGYFLLRRRWTILAWTSATVLASTVASTLVIGLVGLRAYLVDALPGNAFWRAAEGNYSLTSPIWRVFAGSKAIAPAFDLPWLGAILAGLAIFAVLAIAGRAIGRSADPEIGYALAIAAALLVSPTVWQHYFVMLIWPLWVLGKRLASTGWPVGPSTLLVAVLVLLTVPPATILGMATSFGTGADQLPPAAGLPLLFFPAAPLLAFGLLQWTARRYAAVTWHRRANGNV